MKRKPTSLILLILAVLAALCFGGALAGCASDGEFTPTEHDGVKVVYELEGGKYGNSTRAVRRYYVFPDGADKTITALATSEGGIPERAGYVLEGWYRTRTQDGETVTYADEWDFASDRVEGDSLTLYAKWRKLVEHTFDVVYTDDAGAEQVVTSYPVTEEAIAAGTATFSDYLKNSYSRYEGVYRGHTVLCSYSDGAISVNYYSDKACTQPWDPAFTHPGGETSLTVKVYVKFMKGEFSYVTNGTELKRAANVGRSVYLLCDVDMTGVKDFYGFRNTNTKTYEGTFLGNGFTVSNITLSYDKTRSGLTSDDDLGGNGVLAISLFGDLSGAHIENVTFEDVTVDVNTSFSETKFIYVAPIAVKANNATVKGVTVTGSYTVRRLPDGFDRAEQLTVVEGASKLQSGSCTFEEVEAVLTEKTD